MRRLLLACLIVTGGACSTTNRGATGRAPSQGQLPGSENDGRCQIGIGAESPLVTEWAAAEKANLESQLRVGGVAVIYSGCSMRVLSQCRVGGQYLWQRTTPATDSFEIHNEAELYAKLPLGVTSLSGEIARGRALSVETVVAGRMMLQDHSTQLDEVPGCQDATHIVGAVSVGAFELSHVESLSGRAEVDVKGTASAGGSAQRDSSVLRSAGVPSACGNADEEAADRDCASPLQVFLWPIEGRVARVGVDETVNANFVSDDAQRQWHVQSGDETVCTTPCSRWVDPTQPISLSPVDPVESKKIITGPFGPSAERIQSASVPYLSGDFPPGSRVDVRAHATDLRRRRTGILLTMTGGSMTFMGAFFGGFGLAAERDGMAIAGGVVTAGALGLLGAGIWKLKHSSARLEVRERR